MSEPPVDYSDFVKAARFQEIAITDCTARRHSEGEMSSVNMQIGSSVRTRAEHSAMDFRYEFTISAFTDKDHKEKVAEVTVIQVASYESDLVATAETDLNLDDVGVGGALQPEVLATNIGQFGEDVAIMAVYPYARAAVQQLGALIGLPTLVLPMLQRGELSEMQG